MLGKREGDAGVRAAAERLRAQMRQLSAGNRAVTEPLLTRYLEVFDEAAELEIQIARKVQAVEAAAVVVEPLVADIATSGQRDAAAEVRTARIASDRTVVIMTASLLLALLAGPGAVLAAGPADHRPGGQAGAHRPGHRGRRSDRPGRGARAATRSACWRRPSTR